MAAFAEPGRGESNPSRLLPNVAVMPVLGISPLRVFRNLDIDNLNGDFLGNRKAAGNWRDLGQNSSDVPANLHRFAGFRIDLYPDRNPPVVRVPIAVCAFLPHRLHFRFFL
jgi:hypothetical protein